MPYSHVAHCQLPGVEIHWWNLTEPSSQLQQMCLEAGLPCQCDAKAESRRRELLAERLLLARITGSTEVHIAHNADRAPHLEGLDCQVSIAHTRTQLCIALGDGCHAMGIDVENHGRNVAKVRDAFINDAEQQWLSPDDALAHLVAWTAKEAMFKAVSVRDGMHYRDQLVLHPFATPAMGATLRHSGEWLDVDFALITEVIPEHVLTIAWALNAPMAQR